MPQNCPIDVQPYAQPGVINNANIINLNYTNQDFWSLKARLRDFILERFGPNGNFLPNTFNDLVEGQIAIMLMENFAFIGDTLSFKMDQIANEVFIDTVTELENAFRLAELVGFKPQPPIAATSMWSATINSVIAQDVVLPSPVQISIVNDGTPLTIELFPADENNEPIFSQDVIIAAGTLTNQNIIGCEGQTRTEQHVGNGQISQILTLTQSPVLYGSIQVQVDGQPWTQIDAFTDSQPRQEFRVEYDSSWNAYVIFGNNVAGLIPYTGSTIQITYRQGGGILGNIVSGYVSTQKNAVVQGINFSVPVTLTNYTSGNYGYAGDTVDDIRRKLPKWTRTQQRAVAGSDYKTLTDQFSTPYHGQIGKSNPILRNYGCAGNIIDIYILAQNNLTPVASSNTPSSYIDLQKASNNLRVDLLEYLNGVKMLTDNICIRDGLIIPVDVTIEVLMDKFYRKYQDNIQSNILSRATGFFSLSNWDYGQTLKDVDLMKELSDIKQVQSYTINYTTNDSTNSGTIVTAKFYEIIRADQILVQFSYN